MTIDTYNVIISPKSFYDQTINSDIKPYEEIKKLLTGKVKIILLDVYCIMNI